MRKRIRGYQHLSAAERFRLAVLAESRGDSEEVRRLQHTCPRKTYRQPDHDFIEAVQVSQCMTMAFAIDIAQALGQLQALTALSDIYEWGDDIRQRCGRRAIMLMREFDHVSRSYAGLGGEVMLAAWCLPVLQNYRALTADIECDDTEVTLDDKLVEALDRAELPFLTP